MTTYGGIEAGGTKFVCLTGNGPDDITAEVRFPTTTPDETLKRTIAFFTEQARKEPIRAMGIGSFGPVDLNPSSSTYGYITTTPKPGWAQTDVAGVIQKALGVPVIFDTDVNAAAFGEGKWGAAQGLSDFVYLTVGTGIGGGNMINGQLLHGLIHPEIGHIRLPHDRQRDPFPGVCPFHGDCFEGLASGPALKARWGQPAETLPHDHPAWELEAHYIALALNNLVCTLSPQRLILGGGVMQQPEIWPMVRAEVVNLLNGYIHSPEILERIDQYIVPPQLGNRAGVLGALALAQTIG